MLIDAHYNMSVAALCVHHHLRHNRKAVSIIGRVRDLPIFRTRARACAWHGVMTIARQHTDKRSGWSVNNVFVRDMRHKYIRVSDQRTHALIFNAITTLPVCELEWEGRGAGGGGI